jgi:hypothetical protein
MKKISLLTIIFFIFFSCKKQSKMIETPTLDVEEKNMGVVAKRTSVTCAGCGNYGFTKFAQKEIKYGGNAVYMAWKYGLTQKGSDLFWAVGPKFNLGTTTPTFFYNFSEGESITAHVNSPVIVNSNYDFSVSGSTINLKTTTKFFQDANGEFLLAPYLIIDGIIHNQNGHPDGINTVHHKFVADIAKPITTNKEKNFGYKIASGRTKANLMVNLDFETTKDSSWNINQISFGLILYKKQNDSLIFVNAFTK